MLNPIDKQCIDELSTDDKIKSLVQMIDTPIGRRKYPADIVYLAQAIKADLHIPNAVTTYVEHE